MKRTGRSLGMAMYADVFAAWVAHAAEQKSLECTPRLPHSHFGRYPSSTKTSRSSRKPCVSSFHPRPRGPNRSGCTRSSQWPDDFEVSAHYEWTPVAVPKDGYGVSSG